MVTQFKGKKAFTMIGASALALAMAAGCKKGKKDNSDDDETTSVTASSAPVAGTISLGITAGGFDSDAAGAALLGLTVNSPTGNEYAGMGINFGDAVVDGLKIRLTQIAIGSKGAGAGGGPEKTIFDWSSAPKELQIAKGFSGTVDDTVDVAVTPGTYNYMSVRYQDNYDIKAYAYLDRDNDGTVDSTIYTTKADVILANSVIAPADLAALSYDYYHYSFTGLNSKSTDRGPNAVDNNETTGGMTIFREPVEITADMKELSVTLLVAFDRVARVWDGRYGDGAPYVVGDSHVPPPGMPFPKSDDDSRGGSNRFVKDEPDIALDYIPMFAFVNSPAMTSQAYMISKDTNYIGYHSQSFILVLDANGVPVTGRILVNDGSVSPHLGQCAKVFTEAADGSYTFYSEYGVKDANGVDDGGLFYSNDISMAGFEISGFKPLAAVGDTGTLTVTDGPRCKEQYDYCAASATNDLGIAQSVDGTRTLYIKRVR